MAQTHQVSIENMQFNPGSIDVKAGDTVQWTNNMSVLHSVTADDYSFDSGRLSEGQTFSRVFDTAGSVEYHCEVHVQITGTVTVS